jgi:hypothetical protein
MLRCCCGCCSSNMEHGSNSNVLLMSLSKSSFCYQGMGQLDLCKLVLLLSLGLFIGISLFTHECVFHSNTPPLMTYIPLMPTVTYRASNISCRSCGSGAVTSTSSTGRTPSCALLFFGVPRMFREAALPSIQKYLIEPNPNCDIFVHTYNITILTASRNNESNGALFPRDVYKLHPTAARIESVRNVLKMRDMSFFRKNHHPGWGDCCSSTVNMVKQWHSISGAWTLMEHYAQKTKKRYDRVGLFRLDVFYTHPIYVVRPTTITTNDSDAIGALREENGEEQAVVPHFLWVKATPEHYFWNFTNDRMFYGNYQYAKIWATQRFDRVKKYINRKKTRTKVEMMRYDQGIHSESFMDYLLRDIPKVQKNPICFWRLRTTGTVRYDDCNLKQTLRNMEQNKKILLQSLDCCWDCIPGQFNCTIKRNNSTSIHTP